MANHAHDTHHGHAAAPDKGAAYVGLIIAAIFLLTVVVTIVKLTNSHYASEGGKEAPAAEAPR